MHSSDECTHCGAPREPKPKCSYCGCFYDPIDAAPRVLQPGLRRLRDEDNIKFKITKRYAFGWTNYAEFPTEYRALLVNPEV